MINVLTLNRLITSLYDNFNITHYSRWSIGSDPDFTQQRSIKNALIDQYRRCFTGLGFDADFQFDSDAARSQSGLHAYAVEVKLNKTCKQYVCIALCSDRQGATDQSILTMLFNQGGDEGFELFAQLLHNLNYSVCAQLTRKGYTIKHGPVQYHRPESKHEALIYCTVKKLGS